MEIVVDVINQRLKLPTNLKDYVEGSQNFVKFTFNMGSEWDDLLVFASFYQNGKTYNAYLDETNSAYLPPEIVAGTCTISLYGSYGTIKATTHPVTLRIDNSLVIDSENIELSASLYTQLATQVHDLMNWINEYEDEMVLSWIELD